MKTEIKTFKGTDEEAAASAANQYAEDKGLEAVSVSMDVESSYPYMVRLAVVYKRGAKR